MRNNKCINPFSKEGVTFTNFKDVLMNANKKNKKLTQQEQIDALNEKVGEMVNAFKDIANSDTTSIAKIRTIAKRFVEEEEA